MSPAPRQRRLLTVLAWLAALHVLLDYGLPEWLFIALLIGLGVMYWRVGAAGAVLTSVMLLIVTVFYGVALHLTGFEDRMMEKFAARFYHPRKGTEYVIREMVLPHLRQSYKDLEAAAHCARLLITHVLTYAAPLPAGKAATRRTSEWKPPDPPAGSRTKRKPMSG